MKLASKNGTESKKNIKQQLPQLRANRHFRITSAFKERKTQMTHIISTNKTKRKSLNLEEIKRFCSQKKRKICESQYKEETNEAQSIKKFTFQKIDQRKFIQKEEEQVPFYESVKTEQVKTSESKKFLCDFKTVDHEDKLRTLQRIAKICDPNRILSKDKLQQIKKISCERVSNTHEPLTERKQEKQKQKEKEFKGKYRCRVNQYVFDQNRKRVIFKGKEEETTVEEFWKNINESMILASRNQEQPSKDLREFVINLATE